MEKGSHQQTQNKWATRTVETMLHERNNTSREKDHDNKMRETRLLTSLTSVVVSRSRSLTGENTDNSKPIKHTVIKQQAQNRSRQMYK